MTFLLLSTPNFLWSRRKDSVSPGRRVATAAITPTKPPRICVVAGMKGWKGIFRLFLPRWKNLVTQQAKVEGIEAEKFWEWMVGKGTCFFLERPVFRGYVSFREGKLKWISTVIAMLVATNICKKSNDSNHCNPQPHSCSFDKLLFCGGDKATSHELALQEVDLLKKNTHSLNLQQGSTPNFFRGILACQQVTFQKENTVVLSLSTRYYTISGAPDYLFLLFFQRSSCLTYHHLNCTTLRFWDGKYGALGSYGTINMSSSQSLWWWPDFFHQQFGWFVSSCCGVYVVYIDAALTIWEWFQA